MNLTEAELKSCARVLANSLRYEFKGDKPLSSDEWTYDFAKATGRRDLSWKTVNEIVDKLCVRMVGQ